VVHIVIINGPMNIILLNPNPIPDIVEEQKHWKGTDLLLLPYVVWKYLASWHGDVMHYWCPTLFLRRQMVKCRIMKRMQVRAVQG
jgi:hypothetical protein